MSARGVDVLAAEPAAALPGPAVLSAQARQSARALIAAAQAPNTVARYESAIGYWCSWVLARYGCPLQLPVPPATVIQFVVDHVRRPEPDGQLVHDLPLAVDQALVDAKLKGALGPLKMSTVLHRLSVLSALHRANKQSNPCADPEVRYLVARAKRLAAKLGERPLKKTAATKEPLEAMLATCDDSLAGCRDRAILLLGWASGGRRRSEIAAVQVGDLRPAGGGQYSLAMGSTKNEAGTDGTSRDKPVTGRAAAAVTAWLAASGLTEGALFRRLWKNRLGTHLSGAAIAQVVKRRARLAGIEGDWAGHSLRSGFVSEAGRQRAPLGEVIALTEHRHLGTALGYFQAGSLLTTRTARLLEVPDGSGSDDPAKAES